MTRPSSGADRAEAWRDLAAQLGLQLLEAIDPALFRRTALRIMQTEVRPAEPTTEPAHVFVPTSVVDP